MNVTLTCTPCHTQPEREAPRESLAPTGERSLAYRPFDYAGTLAAMVRRLSLGSDPALRWLTARECDDPAVALLDAWAIIADVLGFYQERIVNEGYLRTAAERRSLVELARLVGYRSRPGVAASAHLAFSAEGPGEVEIAAGTQVRSLPDPGQRDATFETTAPLRARAEWNAMRLCLTRSQVRLNPDTAKTIYLAGIATGLRPNDPLLIGPGKRVRWVQEVHPQPEHGRTRVTLWRPTSGPNADGQAMSLLPETAPIGTPALPAGEPAQQGRQPSWPGLAQAELRRRMRSLEAATTLLGRVHSIPTGELRGGLTAGGVAQGAAPQIYALRTRAALFGHNAPPPSDPKTLQPTAEDQRQVPEAIASDHALALDAVYERIAPGSAILAVRTDDPVSLLLTVDSVDTLSLAAFGVAGRVTRLSLDHPQGAAEQAGATTLKVWAGVKPGTLDQLRKWTIYAQPEELLLAGAPRYDESGPDTIGGEYRRGQQTQTSLMLDRLYTPLEAERWLIVAGERADNGVTGVELVQVAEVDRGATATDTTSMANPALGAAVADTRSMADPALGAPAPKPAQVQRPGDPEAVDGAGRPITGLTVAPGLRHSYRPETVVIYGNVVLATHGERREEVLGSGDSGVVGQRFTLKQGPLTYVSDDIPGGAASTLEVFVDGVRWEECSSLEGVGPTRRAYTTEVDAEGHTVVIFGDGHHGARPPTGVENISARYRIGLGAGGNLRAGQLSQLATRPFGLKGVVNPLPTSGGADPECAEQIRRNAPLGVRSLGRVVSVPDHASFARVFAGVGKAHGDAHTDGTLIITVAGADDASIGADAELLRNLGVAMARYGSGRRPVIVPPTLKLLVIAADVRTLPEYRWPDVEHRIREALYSRLGFERRDFGQPVRRSEVIGIIQSILGVRYVDLNMLALIGGGAELSIDTLAAALSAVPGQPNGTRRPLVQRIETEPYIPRSAQAIEDHTFIGAELVFLDRRLPGTLVLVNPDEQENSHER